VDKSGKRAGNPHVWLDPMITKQFSGRICGELSKLDPANASYYKANYLKFSAGLDKLDKYFSAETKKFRVKEVISFHPAWVYFEKRYGLSEAGVIEAVPGKEPTPRELEAIIAAIKRYGISTIFAEPQLPRKAADVIAHEAGVNVLIIDPNGAPDGDYIGFMNKNFEIIKKAMM
jgi:zinc transport system substrate-binding protein